ncbi:flagellar type III secretion system pore protein FliP [Rhodomicrobium lacus]|uniref:flagellar type III secretion system pore protein FliP n=1 Tax=Rhodomicrobium lacus TaxID=2498452 RepID=UPI001FDFE2DB|nr:flagellar type III secretion system pore protein FliP [Rhodomicrobium lacus]WKW50680.1 flagellar type III secretion system pore protein FliP [Rhodomicrobium lacus]
MQGAIAPSVIGYSEGDMRPHPHEAPLTGGSAGVVSTWRGRRATAALVLILLILVPASACAQQAGGPLGGLASLFPETADGTSSRIIQLVLVITVLSLAPGILIMVTCFTRFVIALSFLRVGLGLPSTPANIILVSLALFMTAFTMSPTFEKAWETGVRPFMDKKLSEDEAFYKITDPFREFMMANVRQKDLDLFSGMSRQASPEGTPTLRMLIPAFMISELRRGFEIGFLIMLPFLVIDLIASTVLMAMGMMMVAPTTVSLPFKVLFFILIDGWNLLVGNLVRSFN